MFTFSINIQHFTTAFLSALHRSLPWASLILSTPSHSISATLFSVFLLDKIARSYITSYFWRLVAGFQRRWPIFDPRPCNVGFVVDKVTLGQVFSKHFDFPHQFSLHQQLYVHLLSSLAGTIGPEVARVPSGLSMTPPHGRRTKLRRWTRHSGYRQWFTVKFHACVPCYTFTTDIITPSWISWFRVRMKILTAERFLCSTMLSSFSCNLLNIYVPCQFRVPASICISSWCIVNCISARITQLVNYFNDVNVAER
jgi:hypothetical protein